MIEVGPIIPAAALIALSIFHECPATQPIQT